VKFNLIYLGGVIVMNLFPGYSRSIVWPHGALCHFILDIRHELDGVAHNIIVGYAVFLYVNRTPN
jgi:hypothetical protein